MSANTTDHQLEHLITSEIHDLGGVKVYAIKPGILVSEYYGNVVLDMELVFKINKKVCRLSEGKAVPQLFIACEGLHITKQVREWGTTALANRYTSQSAVVCDQLAHRIMGNFVIKVQKPFRPTRMFNSVDKAVEWLGASLQ